MSPPDLLLIVPTSAGVRAVINGLEIYKPMTGRQLLDMSIRFAEAAAERMGQDTEQAHKSVGRWDPIAVENCR